MAEPLVAFLDGRSQEDISIEDILRSPSLFKVWVDNSAIESGRWVVIGHTDDISDWEYPYFFKQDPISKKYSLTLDGSDGIKVSREACEGLERAAVWSAEHVEDRLRDFYAGVSNKWVDALKL